MGCPFEVCVCVKRGPKGTHVLRKAIAYAVTFFSRNVFLSRKPPLLLEVNLAHSLITKSIYGNENNTKSLFWVVMEIQVDKGLTRIRKLEMQYSISNGDPTLENPIKIYNCKLDLKN